MVINKNIEQCNRKQNIETKVGKSIIIYKNCNNGFSNCSIESPHKEKMFLIFEMIFAR